MHLKELKVIIYFYYLLKLEKDENFADSVANQTQDSGSMSDELGDTGDTESECITEM